MLQKMGLNNNEAKAYFELLKLGQSKVSGIVKRMDMPRTSVYNILDSLIAKGMVSYIIKSGVKHFEAVDPERLLLKEKEKLNSLKSVLPYLKKVKESVKEKPSVELFEGKEGLKTILEIILKMPEKSTLYAYANSDLFERLHYYFPNFIKRRAKQKIYAKIIQEKTSLMRKYKKSGKSLLLTMKFVPERFDSNVFVFGNKIAMITFRNNNLLGVLIENKSISKTQKTVFDKLWKSATE